MEAGGTVIRAVLQLSLRAGFALEADLIPGPDVELGPFNTEDFKAAAGLETRVYANIAELKTNITFGDDDDCDLRVQQAFQLAVGAAAGAYVGIGNRTWGPMPETEVPMFPTTFAGECVTKTKIEPKTTGIVEPRAPEDDSDLTTTTLTREATYTAVQCGETGAINCPANKETYREYAATETLMTSVASGSDATWPATITGAVNTKDFGKGAVAITSSSGKPKPDDPKTADDDDGFFDQETGGVSNKVIIGVSVGLGVPFIIALIAGIMYVTAPVPWHFERLGC